LLEDSKGPLMRTCGELGKQLGQRLDVGLC
jgi:hypothetical protein